MMERFSLFQKLGKELVKNTTRQRAQDFGAAELMLIHTKAEWEKGQDESTVVAKRELLNDIRTDLQKENIEFTILGLPDNERYW